MYNACKEGVAEGDKKRKTEMVDQPKNWGKKEGEGEMDKKKRKKNCCQDLRKYHPL